ncbi:MAG: hypothetical protein RR959_08290 [Erysipelotrichaceae bacterium]
MNIESKTFVKSLRTIHMGYGTTADFTDIESPLSKTMNEKLVKYALNRLDKDLRELVLNKGYKVVVERMHYDTAKTLNDSSYQVNFISESGLMISVDCIYLNSANKPFLDHGVSLAEGQ